MNSGVVTAGRAIRGRGDTPPRRVSLGSARARAMRLAARTGRSSAAASLLLLTLGCFFARACGDFHRGDLIASSRRAQFHGHRTQWHDLLARHCPSFGVDRVVAIALPKPLELKEEDDYKLALAFDHDRHLTGWLTLIDARTRERQEAHLRAVAERRRLALAKKKRQRGSKRSTRAVSGSDETDDAFDAERDFDAHPPYVPMVHVRFVRGEDGAIRGADAEVVPVAPSYLRTHRQFVREFHNTTVWPKHVLIRYTWDVRLAVDEDAGAFAMLFVFVLAFFFASFAATSATKWTDIAEFVDALGAEQDRRAEAHGSRMRKSRAGGSGSRRKSE